MVPARFRLPLRRLLLVASLLALTPATGMALCVGAGGHMAIELIPEDCGRSEPGARAECATECHDCEDTPLSIGFARGAQVRYDAHAFAAVVPMPAFAELRIDLGACIASSSPPCAPSLSPRPAQLRC